VKLWRLPLSIWCVFPLISFFFMSIGEDIDFAYLFILPFYYIFLGIFAYIYLFPLIVCDDLLRAAHDTETGTKESIGSRLGYWNVTAAFLLLLAVILGCVAASDVTVRDQLKRAEFDSYSSAMAEKQAKGAVHIRADAGLDIADVMEYTYEHQVTDWTYCPDESMEGQWSRLFSDDAEIRAYDHIRDNGGSYEMTVVYDGYGYTISTGDRGLTINSSYYREDENGQQIEYTAPYPEDERRRSLW
ncbi:MAG: hypothetical protein IKR73_01430, partial [Oscillospiraceae bacterium]|nr:hypothetical protein [Oscillospiraceae bacterium]